MKKVLFIVAHRKDRAPNQRFRFEQYFSFLERNGFACTLSPLIATAKEDNVFYQGNLLKKIPLGIKLIARRIKDSLRASDFDIIFIAREAFVTGHIVFEKWMKRSKARIIFDFDDSIWIDVVSTNNRALSWLKNADKTARIIRLADRVFAGNDYLADYARPHNASVVIVPTTIDTDAYQPNYSLNKAAVTIGWSGSVSTIAHFTYAIPALTRLKEKYGSRIDIKVIGDANYRYEPLGIVGTAWSSKTEIADLQTIDIGIMPLPDDEWTKGKCGLKGLQYMALEIPTVMSPVGVNTKIIDDGHNGFLASGVDEWVEKLSRLVEDADLRVTLGREGRKKVVEKYSVRSEQDTYLREFTSLLKSSPVQ